MSTPGIIGGIVGGLVLGIASLFGAGFVGLSPQVNDLELQLDEANDQISNLEQSVVAGEEALVGARLGLDVRQEELTAKQVEIDDLIVRREQLQQELAPRQAEVAALKAERESLWEEASSLEAQMDSLLLEVTSLEGQLAQANARIQERQQENLDLQVEIIELQEQFEVQLKGQIEERQARIDELQERFDDLAGADARIGELESQIGSLNQQIASLDSQIADHESKISLLESIINLELSRVLMSGEFTLAPGDILVLVPFETTDPSEIVASGYLIINYTATSEVAIEVEQFEPGSSFRGVDIEVAMISPGADGLEDELIFPIISVKEYLVLVHVSTTATPSTIVTVMITWVY